MSSEDEVAPQRPAATTKSAMDRFLRTAGSDSSESDSDEESESESDGDGNDDEDESGQEDRAPVRIISAVDKRLKEMEATGVVIENGLKINDWVAISNGTFCLVSKLIHSLNLSNIEFDKLVRMIQRQQNLSEPVPAFFIKFLVKIENSINTTIQKEKEAKKKMNPSNAKALTAMKQKIKKSTKEYEADVKKYQDVSKLRSVVLSLRTDVIAGSRSI